MNNVASRFRPWLDDPGRWPDWDLDAGEQQAFAAALTDGAAVAAERLAKLYGAQAETFGATALVRALAAQSLPEADLQSAALTIAAADHHRARLAVPRAGAGGLTDPTNIKRWQELRPYLVARALAMLRDNAADALMWRAIFGRVADAWVPVAQLTRAIHQELSASGLFNDIEVTLELTPPVAGGGRWIALQCKGTLAELRHRLGSRKACLVELIRDAEGGPPATELAVAYRLEDELTRGRDGVERVRLWLYDPRRGDTAVSLRITLAEDRLQVVELPAAEGRPSVKALRLVTLAAADPPFTGWRRWFRPVHPWGAFWWLRRVCLLASARKRDRS